MVLSWLEVRVATSSKSRSRGVRSICTPPCAPSTRSVNVTVSPRVISVRSIDAVTGWACAAVENSVMTDTSIRANTFTISVIPRAGWKQSDSQVDVVGTRTGTCVAAAHPGHHLSGAATVQAIPDFHFRHCCCLDCALLHPAPFDPAGRTPASRAPPPPCPPAHPLRQALPVAAPARSLPARLLPEAVPLPARPACLLAVPVVPAPVLAVVAPPAVTARWRGCGSRPRVQAPWRWRYRRRLLLPQRRAPWRRHSPGCNGHRRSRAACWYRH